MLSCSVVSNSLWPQGLYVACSLLCPGGFSRQGYWSGLPRPPPGNLPNPGIEPRSPALQVDSLPSEPLGKSKNTGVSIHPFSRRSSQLRNQTRVSCIAGRFFTNWATREALSQPTLQLIGHDYMLLPGLAHKHQLCNLLPFFPLGF